MSSAHAGIDPRDEIAPIDRRLFGGFVEHLGRHIYDGIHEPGHASADDAGFRRDVIELVKELGVTTIRYPGGNFVSGYRWEDGIGPREQRPRRLDLAWHATETNEVGLHEFAQWLEAVDSDLMLAVNLGTRGTQEALDLLEYANTSVETDWTRRRARNGRPAPFAVTMWCLGNEMDGPWQLGHRNADDYGKLASRTAKAMRQLDPSIELVACGSSGRGMPTFGEWERTVLGHVFDDVDFISCHAYYQERDGKTQEFLTSGEDMARFIREVVATADHVAASRKSDKRIMISFDEWNVWYLTRWEEQARSYGADDWPIAPRQLEDEYSALDAVVFGDLLITLLQHSDRVRSASLAQLVNVIAPIMTEPGGPAWRQTTFHPFALTSRLAGNGRAVRVRVDCPMIATERFGDVAAINAVATLDESGCSLFLTNRSLTEEITVTVDTRALAPGRAARIVESHLLHEDDLAASNTLADRDRVIPHTPVVDASGTGVRITVPPVSWGAVRMA